MQIKVKLTGIFKSKTPEGGVLELPDGTSIESALAILDIPAGVCRELITYRIASDLCVGCPVCRNACPAEAISGEHKKVHVIDQSACTRCGVCYEVCPPKVRAVKLLAGRLESGGQD